MNKKSSRVAGACVALSLVLAVSAWSQSLPNELSDQVILTGLSQPSGFTFLPDGRIIVVEQRTALVKVFAGGPVGTLGTVPNVNSGANERGLLGVDVDPNWPQRPYLYCYYSHTLSGRNFMRLSMFPVSGALTNPASTNLTLGNEYAIITDIPDQAGNHNGGTCRFGPDGTLFVSIGDDASQCQAQDISDLRGVILRIDVSKLPGQGSGPPPKADLVPKGNPFSGPNDNARLTWAYGLRNPFRLQTDAVTGHIYIADVGLRAYEEMDESIQGGENFGWPWREGPAAFSSCTGTEPPSVAPIAYYDRRGMNSASIMAFPRYRNRLGGAFNFGNNYEGDLFFSEYYQGFVRRIQFVGNQWTAAPPVPGQPNNTDWATGISFASDSLVGPDGALYYVQQFPGTIHRIIRQVKLPEMLVAATAKAGQPYAVVGRRNPGDLILIAFGTIQIAPTPLSGFYGRLEMVGIPLFSGIANSQGALDFTFPLVPTAAIGVTVHFQCLAVANNDNYLSPLKSTQVVR